MRPRGVDLEIVEQRPAGQIDDYHVVIPNHCTINGLPVLVSDEEPIRIKATNLGVLASMTLLVGTLHVQAADELTDDRTMPPILAALCEDTAPDTWYWPDPELLTWAACVQATARTHNRNPGEYGRRL